MIEPASMTLAAAFLYHQVAHEGLLGKFFEDLFGENAVKVSEHVLHAVRDTINAGKLPGNDELLRAASDSLKKAGIALVDALACRLDSALARDSWASRLCRRLVIADLMSAGSGPEMEWVQNLIGALKDQEKLDSFRLQVGTDSVAFLDEIADRELASELHRQFTCWARRHVGVPGMPCFFEDFVFNGWHVEGGTLTLYQAYCLFFREHIKHDPGVVGIFTGQTLALIQHQLHKLAQTKPLDQAELNAALCAGLAAALDRQLGSLRGWLDSQLSQIPRVLGHISETQERHTNLLLELAHQGAETQQLMREQWASLAPLQGKITPLEAIRQAHSRNKLLDNEDFDWISNSRRECSQCLNEKELAFALRCALKHGKNLPYWCRVNADNPCAIESIMQPIFENHGRRPLLRAGFAMEKLNSALRDIAFDKAYSRASRLKELGFDVPLRIVNAAKAGRTLELWKDEFRDDPTYGAVISIVIQEITEPDN